MNKRRNPKRSDEFEKRRLRRRQAILDKRAKNIMPETSKMLALNRRSLDAAKEALQELEESCPNMKIVERAEILLRQYISDAQKYGVLSEKHARSAVRAGIVIPGPPSRDLGQEQEQLLEQILNKKHKGMQ